jgi:hypothetical protein
LGGEVKSPQTIPLTAQTIPLTAQTIPLTSQTIPLTSQTIPLTAQTIPLTAQTIPLTAQTIPLTAQTIPLTAQTSLPAISICFLHLKKHLAGQKFHEDEETKNEVTTWLRALAAEFCDIGIQNLVPRLNKCRDKVGDYVEK